MVVETAAFLSSMKALYEISNALLGIRDSVQMNMKIMELKGAIIDAQQRAMAIQQDYFTMETKAREAKAECVRLKDWSCEKQNYSSKEIATGVFAYVANEIMGDFEHAHKYCCNCFDSGQKSLLQKFHSERRMIGLNCPHCNFKASVYGFLEPSNMQTSIKAML